jgi:hypothetical protein
MSMSAMFVEVEEAEIARFEADRQRLPQTPAPRRFRLRLATDPKSWNYLQERARVHLLSRAFTIMTTWLSQKRKIHLGQLYS